MGRDEGSSRETISRKEKKTQVKTFNEVEKIPDKIQIKLNFLKTPQTLFNILKLSINYHKFSLSLLGFYQVTCEFCL